MLVASPPQVLCGTPYQDATVVQQAPALYPRNASRHRKALVVIRVTIDPVGSLSNAFIAQSSGDIALDAAALKAARESTYAPKIVKCRPMTGSYLLRFVLDPAIVKPPHEAACGDNLPTPAPTAYLSRKQILARIHLLPGEQILGATRESYGEYEKRYAPGVCDNETSPATQVWVIRLRFTQPRQFMSARYAAGIEATALDASTGAWKSTQVIGKFLCGPFACAPRPHRIHGG